MSHGDQNSTDTGNSVLGKAACNQGSNGIRWGHRLSNFGAVPISALDREWYWRRRERIRLCEY